MDSDGGLDSSDHTHNPEITNNKEKKNVSAEASSSKSVVKIVGDYSLTKKPLEEDLKDPRPGPSNSASDFDLEVFDSGSSCSNEECWTVLPDKKLNTELEELDKEVESRNTKTMEECVTESETELAEGNKTQVDQDEDSAMEAANAPGSSSSQPPAATVTSQTGSRSGGQQPKQQQKRNRETQTNSDLLNISEPGPSTSKGVSSELPRETLSRKVSVEMWKSRNETETIVEDHDVYGTDENEDSLDSLIQNDDSLPSTAISSRRTSICGEVIVVDHILTRCCSRASNAESINDVCDTETGHQPICGLHTQTCSAKTGSCYEVNTSDPSSNNKISQDLPCTGGGVITPLNTISRDQSAVDGRVTKELRSREEGSSRPVSASGLCRRLQLIEVVSSSKEEEADLPHPPASRGDHLKPDNVGNDEADGGEVGDKPEDDVYSAVDDAAPSETTNTDSDSNMSSLNNSTMVIPTSKPHIQTANFQTQTDFSLTSSNPPPEYSATVADNSGANNSTSDNDNNGYNNIISGGINPAVSSDNAVHSDNNRPKRKSGSFTELSLACLPLKRQKPEELSPSRRIVEGESSGANVSGSGSNSGMAAAITNPFSFNSSRESQVLTFSEGTPDGGSTNANSVIPPLMTSIGGSSITALTRGSSSLTASLDDSLLNQDNSYLSLCDNTAPTSPASPSPSDGGDMEGMECSPSPRKICSPGPRSLLSPGGGVRCLIPDKENPPQEILSWVSTFSRWSNAERLMAINQLINTCEPQQVRHMMQVIEPQFQRDFISLLPKELALYVLSYLEPKDLLRAAQTCRYWRILAEDNLLWREKCRESGVSEYSSREQYYRRRKHSSGFTYSPWKLGFMRQHNIEMNWRSRPIKSPKVLKGHDDHVITCLQFSGSRIVSGSDDNTLKVWSAVTGKCLRTLVGHTGGVWSSQLQGNVIVSGSTDRTLKVWNAETGSCTHTLYGHTSTVRCMHLHKNKVVSGSRDATLRMWDIETGECNIVLIGHVAAVRCVQYDGRLVVSGAYDYMVKVWNPEREECIHTLNGHTNRVYSLQFDGVHVVSGSLDTSIRVWDVETGSCKHALMGHQSLTSGMELKDNILVSGNADSTVKIWDILTGQCLQTLSGPNKHQSAVTCLHFNKKFVITSSDDGTVKLWDVKTGDYIRDLVSLESGGSGGVVWRIRSSPTKLVCAVGSRNGTEETKLLVLDFEAELK